MGRKAEMDLDLDRTMLVPLNEVAPHAGGTAEAVGYQLRKTGLEDRVVRDWLGRPSVPASVAAQVLTAYRAERDASEALMSRYRRFLADQKAQAAARRREEIAEVKRRIAAERDERRRAAREAALAKQLTEDAAKPPRELPFEEWRKRFGGDV